MRSRFESGMARLAPCRVVGDGRVAQSDRGRVDRGNRSAGNGDRGGDADAGEHGRRPLVAREHARTQVTRVARLDERIAHVEARPTDRRDGTAASSIHRCTRILGGAKHRLGHALGDAADHRRAADRESLPYSVLFDVSGPRYSTIWLYVTIPCDIGPIPQHFPRLRRLGDTPGAPSPRDPALTAQQESCSDRYYYERSQPQPLVVVVVRL